MWSERGGGWGRGVLTCCMKLWSRFVCIYIYIYIYIYRIIII